MEKENGSALIIAIVVMALLSAAILGLSRDTDIDLTIGRNSRVMKQSFLWGDSGLEVTEKLIDYSVKYRGKFDNSTTPVNNLSISYHNAPLYTPTNNTSIDFIQNGETVSTTSVRYIGQYLSDGNSIKFESSSEGVGYGAGSGSVVAKVYSLNATGNSDDNRSRKRIAEIYTYIVN